MPTTSSPVVNMGAQRAAIIQVMLGLLDQDQETVRGTIPILQALTRLPLENLTTRRECLLQLQRLEPSNSSPPKRLQPYDPHFDAASDIPTSESADHDQRSDDAQVDAMPPSFVYEYDDPPLCRTSSSSTQPSTQTPAGKSRDSGRVKSLSLHHCKEFLLACANEIHELDTENPNFDYAEDTASEPRTARRGLRQLLDRRTHAPRSAPAREKRRAAPAFDYASTASSSDVSVVTDEMDHDDIEADQGSEFSEVLRRADYLSDVDSDDLSSAASWSQPVADERFNSVHRVGGAHGRQLELQRRAFDALKQNCVQIQMTRTRRAFQRIKSHAQQMRLKRLAMTNLRLATWPRRQLLAPTATSASASSSRALRAKFVLSQHLDLVFVVLCAVLAQTLSS